MKKILCFLCLLPIIAAAQSKEDTIPDTHYGVQFGMNASRVTGTTFWGISKVGLYGLFYFQKDLNEHLAWELDFGYSQKGTLKPPNHKEGDFTKYLMRLDYLQLEWLLRYNRKGIIYEGGLGLGYLLDASETDENEQVITGNGEFRTYEVFLNLGVHFPLSESVSVGVRASHSAIPVRLHNNGATFRFNRGQYNQVLSFAVRYTFLNR